MKVCLLGPPEMIGKDGRTWFRSHRQRAVFAALALNANHVVTVDRLVDVAWTQAPPPTASTQIQKAVCALRPVLERAGGWIDTVFPGYVLPAGADDVDAWAFQRETLHAADHLSRGYLEQAVTGFRQALARWFGRALEGVPGLAADATYLEECRLLALERCLYGELLLGRRAEVAAELEHLGDAYPLRERLRALQIVTLCLCGRRAEALRVYEGARRVLADELALEPGAELRSAAAAVLTGAPADPLDLIAAWAGTGVGEPAAG